MAWFEKYEQSGASGRIGMECTASDMSLGDWVRLRQCEQARERAGLDPDDMDTTPLT